jgi:hypothetical protein
MYVSLEKTKSWNSNVKLAITHTILTTSMSERQLILQQRA